MPVQATAVTRFGIGGAMWSRLGGDYSNKVAGTPADGTPGVDGAPGREGGILAGYQRGKRLEARIQQDDQEFLEMAQQALPEILKKLH